LIDLIKINNVEAFTILEVMMMLTVITILSTSAFTAWHSYYQKLRLESVTKSLLSDIKYVQQQSIITNLKHGIVFDLTNNCYYLIRDKAKPQILAQNKLTKVKLAETNLPNYNKLGFFGRGIFYKKFGTLDNRNGELKLKLNNKEERIVFSSNAGEVNIR